jgi:hypothetical protein
MADYNPPPMGGSVPYPQQDPMQVPQYAPAPQYAQAPQDPQQQMSRVKPAKSAKQVMEKVENVFIKQKPQFAELLGCEFENIYKVYSKKPGKEKGDKKLFKCKEKSGCCDRNCLPAACRPFHMTIEAKCRDTNGKKEKKDFLKLVRDCHCTCCCLNRPFVEVHYVEDGNNQYLGRINDPCACCEYNLSVVEEGTDAGETYRISGSCCQCGLICPSARMCGKNVSFGIFEGGGNAEVGKVERVG